MDLATIDYITTGDPTEALKKIAVPFYQAVKGAARWRRITGQSIMDTLVNTVNPDFESTDWAVAATAADQIADKIMEAREKKKRMTVYPAKLRFIDPNLLDRFLVNWAARMGWQGTDFSWVRWASEIDFEYQSRKDMLVVDVMSFDGRCLQVKAIHCVLPQIQTGSAYLHYKKGKWDLVEFVPSHWYR